MAMYKIVDTDGNTTQNHEMLKRLGVRKLPKEGMPEREMRAVGSHGDLTWEVGVTVWVAPQQRGPLKHRIRCRCPGCAMEMSVGRLFQHVCKRGAK